MHLERDRSLFFSFLLTLFLKIIFDFRIRMFTVDKDGDLKQINTNEKSSEFPNLF